MDRYYIELLRQGLFSDTVTVANCLYKYEGIISVFDRVISIIANYNRNLSKSTLPHELLAVRIFEEEDIKGTLGHKKPILANASSYELQKMYKGFNYLNEDNGADESYGRIGVVTADMWYNEINCPFCLFINFEEKYINLTNIIQKVKILDTTINPKDYNVSNFDISYISFNMIDDVYNFIKENENGWVDTDGINLYLPFATD